MTFDEFCEQHDPRGRRLLRKMRRDLRRMIGELRQLIRDYEWWNNNRLDAEPLDIEPDRVLLSHHLHSLAALERCDMREFNRLSEVALKYAEAEYL